jgi:hypothetical protein
MAVEDVVTAPGKTVLTTGEFVSQFLIPARAANSGDAYLRFIPRTEMDIAVASAGVCLTLNAVGVCTAARVSLGAVAPRALLVAACADALVGSTLDDTALAKLAAAASAAGSGRSGQGWMWRSTRPTTKPARRRRVAGAPGGPAAASIGPSRCITCGGCGTCRPGWALSMSRSRLLPLRSVPMMKKGSSTRGGAMAASCHSPGPGGGDGP